MNGRENKPDEKSVQIIEGPFLRLPPAVPLAFERIALHCCRRHDFRNSLQEDGAPCNIDLMLAQMSAKLELFQRRVKELRSAIFCLFHVDISEYCVISRENLLLKSSSTHPSGMLVRLESEVKHLGSLFAFLIDQFIADSKQAGKAVLDNDVELRSIGIFVRFVSE